MQLIRFPPTSFVFIRGSKQPRIRVHPWFKTPNPRATVTPHPRPLSPSRGEGCRGVISGWKARATWNAAHPFPTHLIRVHSWFKTAPHSCPFVVQNGPACVSIRVHSWFNTTLCDYPWQSVFIRGNGLPAAPCIRGVTPVAHDGICRSAPVRPTRDFPDTSAQCVPARWQNPAAASSPVRC